MKILIGLLAILSVSSSAYAYYDVLDTGKIIPTGKYRAIVGPQFITSGENDGSNVSGKFDAGIGESTTIRGSVGFGQDELFYTGLFLKYVPFPDFENQPALGLIGGFNFARESVDHEQQEVLSLRFAPLASKDFDTDIGVVTPYASLPISIAFQDGHTIYPVQLVGGAEFKPFSWENVSFMGEMGLKLNKAFSYVSLSVVFEFEDEK
jgi:hypothetical protein